MMHKWSSIEEVPYCFARSSIKFQRRTGGNWWFESNLRLLGWSQLQIPQICLVYICLCLCIYIYIYRGLSMCCGPIWHCICVEHDNAVTGVDFNSCNCQGPYPNFGRSSIENDHRFSNFVGPLNSAPGLEILCDLSCQLTHWGRDKMDAISLTTCSSAFSWMKMFEFRLKFHWSLFLRVQLTIIQHCLW